MGGVRGDGEVQMWSEQISKEREIKQMKRRTDEVRGEERGPEMWWVGLNGMGTILFPEM